MMRRPWRGKDLDSRTNIIVTKAKLQGLAIMDSDAFSHVVNRGQAGAEGPFHLWAPIIAMRGGQARPSQYPEPIRR
jgi:hypothetical protein